MKKFNLKSQNLDILKELNLIHQQIDNINIKKEVVVRQLKLNKIVVKSKTPLNIKERFRIAVNEFRQKIDVDRKMIHGKIA